MNLFILDFIIILFCLKGLSIVMDGFIGETFLRLLWYREKLELFLELFFAAYQ